MLIVFHSPYSCFFLIFEFQIFFFIINIPRQSPITLLINHVKNPIQKFIFMFHCFLIFFLLFEDVFELYFVLILLMPSLSLSTLLLRRFSICTVSNVSCLKIILTCDSLNVFIASSTSTVSLPNLLILFYHNYIRKSCFTFFYHFMKRRTSRTFFRGCNVNVNINKFPVVMPRYKSCQSGNLCF